MLRNTYPNEGLISTRLDELRSKSEGALVTYLTGGDPSPERFLTNAVALIEGGADIVEVGVPFSDPIADGPVLQAASQRALNQGITPRRVLSLIKELSGQHDLPFVILTYYNPILAMGVDRFLQTARKSGVSGIVVPDAPAQEDRIFQRRAMKHGIDRILLAAPNTDQRRLRQILSETSGFLYLVSLYGVTGPRKTLSESAPKSLGRIRSLNGHNTPVLAGFGISRPNQIKHLLRAGADGAIVGSALVQMVQDHADKNGVEQLLKGRVAALKAATRNFRSAVA